MKSLKVSNINEINKIASEFLKLTKNSRIYLFYGNMGSGKTTFIKALCKELGVTSDVTSPTFSIVNEYITKESKLIYHFDLYRLKDTQELLDTGFEEYIFSNCIIFIEWPEKSEEVIPEQSLSVYISIDKNGNRIIEF